VMVCYRSSMIVHAFLGVIAVVLCVCIDAADSRNTSSKTEAVIAQSPKDKLVKPHAAGHKTAPIAALQKAAVPTLFPWTRERPPEEEPQKYFLTKKQLAPIDSIDCLKQKELEPEKPCDPNRRTMEGPFNIGHYPNWKSAACRSNFEFFCDPDELLPDHSKDLTYVQNRLQDFRETNMVDCNQFQAVMDPDIERRWYQKKSAVYQDRMGMQGYRNFNLAIVLADEWPSSEMDPRSMQYFGRIVMSEWGMTPIYNGVDAENSANQNEMYSEDDYRKNCPNAAMLIILPRYHEAFLSSPSCEFICQSRGGPEVIAETLAGLDRGGVPEAIAAGVKEIERVLKETIPLSLKKVPVKLVNRDSVSLSLQKSDATWVWCLRFIYALIIALAVFSVVAFVYYVLMPQKAEPRRASTADYREVREAMIDAVRGQLQAQANAKAQATNYSRSRTIAIR